MVATRLAAVLLAALTLSASAYAEDEPSTISAPKGLHGFLLRADEVGQATFARTPSFAWEPVRGALRYEFQLSTSSVFREGATIYSEPNAKGPALALPLSLPWMTGNPYALFARVRAVLPTGMTPWSEDFGFNMRWETIAAPLPAYPGLVRWTPIEGATGYDVWYVDAGKVFSTRTNAADQREFYTFHQDSSWTGAVRWRVRASRMPYGSRKNTIPAVSYGPWSPIYNSVNPTFTTGTMGVTAAASDTVSSVSGALDPHRLTPGFAFFGNQGLDTLNYELYRLYVFTDKDCVNMVYKGTPVGSPAYAPRSSGPLDLPKDTPDLLVARGTYLIDGEEGKQKTFDGLEFSSTEAEEDAVPDTPSIAPPPAEEGDGSGDGSGEGSGGDNGSTDSGSGTSSGGTGSGSGSTGGTAPSAGAPTTGSQEGADSMLPVGKDSLGAPVDLWDASWPSSGYYWTFVSVVPIPQTPFKTALAQATAAGTNSLTLVNVTGFSIGDSITIDLGALTEAREIASITGNVVTLTTPTSFAHALSTKVVQTNGTLMYEDRELPADTCAAGRVGQFGKTSEPVVASTTTPHVTGLSVDGRLVSASSTAPTFSGSPVAAWLPAVGAHGYEVQWSKTAEPFQAQGNLYTFATSANLSLKPGVWFYRVRGLNLSLVGPGQKMAWSDPAQVQIAQPTYSVVKPTASASGAKSSIALVKMMVKSAGFSIGVPKGWEQIEVPKNSVVKFAAAVTTAENGAYTNVNVGVAPGRGTKTFAAWTKVLKADVSTIALPATLKTSTVKLPAGTAVKLSYKLKGDDGSDVATLQYAIDAGSKSYILTYTTSPSLSSKYAPVFAASANTFKRTS